jgi:hypothetical protein
VPDRSMRCDPLSLTGIGLASWFTDLMLAQKVAEALWQQVALMMNATPLIAGPAAD